MDCRVSVYSRDYHTSTLHPQVRVNYFLDGLLLFVIDTKTFFLDEREGLPQLFINNNT